MDVFGVEIQSNIAASTERCRATFPQHETFSGPLCPTSELDAVSCRNGRLLFQNAEEKFVALFLTSGLNFFLRSCNVDFLEAFFDYSGMRVTLCSSRLPRLCSAGTGEWEAPWNSLTLRGSPELLGLRDKSRRVHSSESKSAAEKHLTGSVSKNTGGPDCIWLWLPNFMSASV